MGIQLQLKVTKARGLKKKKKKRFKGKKMREMSWGSLPNLFRKDIFIFSMHPINTIHMLNDGNKHKEIKAKFIQRRRGHSVGILLFIELLKRFSWKTMFSLGRNKDFRAILKGAYIHLPIYLFLFGNYDPVIIESFWWQTH